MKANEIATKEDIALILSKLSELTPKESGRIGFIPVDQVKEQTLLTDSTLWRLEQRGVLVPRRFEGSNKKFYKISEIESALEAGK